MRDHRRHVERAPGVRTDHRDGRQGNPLRRRSTDPAPKPVNDGQIVASYHIESHFDIKRDYNPQTGEQLNIIEENTTDRPWYEREHFRVDWSKNLVTDAYDYDTLSLLGVIGGVKYEPFAYTVLDPHSPDAPHFVPAEGYFDVTNKVYATPQQVDLAAFGQTGHAPGLPAPGRLCRGRHLPVGQLQPDRADDPRVLPARWSTPTTSRPDHDGVRFQTLGAFNFDYRRGYARNYGLIDQEWTRFLARYNIWQQSHYYADPPNPDPALRGPIACATQVTTEESDRRPEGGSEPRQRR